VEGGGLMAQMSDEEYEAERKRVNLYRNVLESLVVVSLIIGIITAVFDVAFGGFTPVMWFLLSFWAILIVICMEVPMIRALLERKK